MPTRPVVVRAAPTSPCTSRVRLPSATSDCCDSPRAESFHLRQVNSASWRTGKIERFFRTVRDQFLVELDTTNVADLAELNRLFAAWVEGVYHRRVHSETGEAPLARFDTSLVRYPSPAELREAFLWSETRTVTKVATVSLHGNNYQVDAALVGRRVELVFDPFDLTDIEVRLDGRPMGPAVPQHIGRHAHPAARPEPATGPAPATGIDYLRLVEAQRDADVAAAGGITFHQLPLPNEPATRTASTDEQEDPS